MKKLLLIDGSSYLYRAFHAMPDIRVVAGDRNSAPTGALHGMVNMLESLRKSEPALLGACIFDAHGPTFRDKLYDQYKANRPPMPEDLVAQIKPIHEVVKLLGWQLLMVSGVEADDVIGTLATRGREQGYEVLISSGDKDMAQLVNADVKLVNTMSNERLDEQGVLNKFGVPPAKFIDYLTLMGDSVDNIPGVNKVGPKTAAKWINEYGSLDGVMAAASEMKGAVGNHLREALGWLPLSKTLVTIKTDCDLTQAIDGYPQLHTLQIKPVDKRALRDFLAQYGFRKRVQQLDQEMNIPYSGGATNQHQKSDLFSSGLDALPQIAQTQAVNYVNVLDWVTFDTCFKAIEAAELVAVDTETTSIEPMQAKLVGISFSIKPYTGWYIPLAHDYTGVPKQLPLNEVLERLKPWLENKNAVKLGQNIKYDWHVFANHGIYVRGFKHDTMLESYVLEAQRPHSLESLALRHLGRQGISYTDLCGKGAQQISFSQIDIEKAGFYSAEDSDMTLDVHEHIYPNIAATQKEGKTKKDGLAYIYDLEVATSYVLARIERNGVLIDIKELQQQSLDLGKRIAQIEAQAYELAGEKFNLGSPKQIGEIFFGKLGLPVVKKTAKGAPSTDEDVLEKLALDYPLPAKILEHRSLSKLKSTYTDKLPLMVLPATGRVHTNYAQAVAVTGRLASNEPNLQNIPVRTEEGRRIRTAFIAPPGRKIASADYSQIELRIMAHLSGDEGLLSAFAQGVDVHRATASEVFGVPPDEVSDQQRRYAKVINFGLIYGMSAYGLASNLEIERSAAKNWIDRYFQRYPGVRRYMDETRQRAKEQGYVQTVFGRRLYLPEINSPNGPRRAAAERAAINAPMQGTAADLIKMAMLAMQKKLDEENRETLMIMQVHDELVFEVPEHELDWVKTQVPQVMAEVALLKVPLIAEIGIGDNWEQAH